MSLTRTILSTAIRGNHLPLPGRFPSYRFNSTLAGRAVCACGAKLPSEEKIISLYKTRNLRAVTQLTDCKKLESYNFVQNDGCLLFKKLNEVATVFLPDFEDVVYLLKDSFIMLESLKTPPKRAVGDMTGDHGTQASKFLEQCLQKGLISSIGSVLDVGGQNTSTVDLVSKALGNSDLPSLIIDLSSATPAISQSRLNIKYAIGDAYLFFSSEGYRDCVKDIINEEPTLVLFNNMLNVLKAEDGWATLQAAWSRLRSGDYLFISGLVPAQLEKHGMTKFHEVDGILEFQHKGKFYKSALLPNFADFVQLRLEKSSVILKEDFEQTIEAKHLNLIEVQGYRLLALRKA